MMTIQPKKQGSRKRRRGRRERFEKTGVQKFTIKVRTEYKNKVTFCLLS